MEPLCAALRDAYNALSTGGPDLDSALQVLSAAIARLHIFTGDTRDGEICAACDELFGVRSAHPSESTADGAPTSMLARRPSLLDFIWASRGVPRDAASGAREGALYIAANFMLIAPRTALAQHCVALRKLCLLLLSRERASGAAAAAIAVLDALATSRAGDEAAYAPREVIAAVKSALADVESPLRAQPSPRGAGVALIGRVLRAYAAAMGDMDVDDYFARLGYMLGPERRPGARIVHGCLQGLDAALTAAPLALRRAAGEAAPRILFDRIVTAIGAARSQSSSVHIDLDVPEAALTLFAHHARLFSQHAVSQARPLFDVLYACCHLKNRKRVRYAAPDALEALLRVIAAHAVEVTASGDATAIAVVRRDFDWIVRENLVGHMLQGIPCWNGRQPPDIEYISNRDVELALRGLNVWAPALLAMLGADATAKLALSVLSVVQSATAPARNVEGKASFVEEDGIELDTDNTEVAAHDDDGDNDEPGNTDEARRFAASGQSQSDTNANAHASPGRDRATVVAYAVTALAAIFTRLPASVICDAKLVPPTVALAEELVLAYATLPWSLIGGRGDIVQALLALLKSLAPSAALLHDALEQLVPGALLRTLTRSSDWVSDTGTQGRFILPPTVSSAVVGGRHPLTGSPDTRLIFHYVTLWRELLCKSETDSSTAAEPVSEDASNIPEAVQCRNEEGPYHEADDIRVDVEEVNDDDDTTRRRQARFIPARGWCRLATARAALLDAFMSGVLSTLETSNLSLTARGDVAAALDGGLPLGAAQHSVLSLSSDASILALGMTAGTALGNTGTTGNVIPADAVEFDRWLTCVDLLRFLTPLLLDTCRAGLLRWAHPLAVCAIRGATRAPHASGFLTVLTLVGAIMSGPSSLGWISLQSSNSPNCGSTSDTMELLDAFADEAMSRVQQHTGELLLASLQFVLLLPAPLVAARPGRALDALHRALVAGVTQPPLAILAMHVLERLHSSDALRIRPSLPRLLPSIGAYLEHGTRHNGDGSLNLGVVTVSAVPALTDYGESTDDDDNDGNDTVHDVKLVDCLRTKPKAENRKTINAALLAAGMHGGGIGASTQRLLLYSPQLFTLLLAHDGTGSNIAVGEAEDGEDVHEARGSDADGASDVDGGESVAPMYPANPVDATGGARRASHKTVTSAAAIALLRLLTLCQRSILPGDVCSRAVVLLGRFGADSRHVVAEQDAALRKQLSVGDITNAGSYSDTALLNVTLVLGDTRVELRLNPLLPRTLALATESPVRRTRVAACELLHAISLIVIGRIFASVVDAAASKGLDDDGVRAPSAYLTVFTRLADAALQLAVDSTEPVAVQLFAPLSLQLMRLFGVRDDLPESLALLDVVTTALTGADAGRRDFSAKCFGEFFRWTLKSRPPQELTIELAILAGEGAQFCSEQSLIAPPLPGGLVGRATGRDIISNQGPVSIDALLRRIMAAARHTSAPQRLGACAAWGDIYRTFREDDALISRYALSLMVSFLGTLRMAASDSSSVLGTAVAAAAAVSHCERIVMSRARLLAQRDGSRDASSPQNLFTLVDWLFLRCGDLETQARRRAMQLFDALAPLTLRYVFEHTKLAPEAVHRRVAAIRDSAADKGHEYLPTTKVAVTTSQHSGREWVVRFMLGKAPCSTVVDSTSVSSSRTPRADDTAAPNSDGDNCVGGASRGVVPGTGEAALFSLAESQLLLIERQKVLDSMRAVTSVAPTSADHIVWCDSLAAALDVWTWMLRRDYVDASTVIGVDTATSVPHAITVRAAVAFLSELQARRMHNGEPMWTSDAASVLPVVSARVHRSRAILVCRLFAFVLAILEYRPLMSASVHDSVVNDNRKSSIAGTAAFKQLVDSQLVGEALIDAAFSVVANPSACGIEDNDAAVVGGSSGAGRFVPEAAAAMIRGLLHSAAQSSSSLASDVTAIVTHAATREMEYGGHSVGLFKRHQFSLVMLPHLLGHVGSGRSVNGGISCARLAQLVQLGHLLFHSGLLRNGSPDGAAARPSIATTGFSRERFAAALGAAVWAIPAGAHPERVRLGAIVLELALDAGWVWEGDDASLGATLLLTSTSMAGTIAIGEAFAATKLAWDRYRLILLRHLLRNDVYVHLRGFDEGEKLLNIVASTAEFTTWSSRRSEADARVDLKSYPVLALLVHHLLTTTTASRGSADDSRADWLWCVLNELVRYMTRASVMGASAQDGGGGEPKLRRPAAAISAQQGETEPSSCYACVRSSVFVNSLIASLQTLQPWAAATASNACVLQLMSIVRAIAAFDPWLLVLAEGEIAAAVSVSRGQQLRALPESAQATLVAVLGRCARSRSSSPDMQQSTAVLAAFIGLLPNLLPGYASTSLMPATTIANFCLLWREGATGSCRATGRTLSPVYYAALRAVENILDAEVPHRSSELRGVALTEFRSLVRLLLAALVTTGSLPLLRLLHRLLREGDASVVASDVGAALTALAAAVAPDGDSPRIIVSDALVTCLTVPAPRIFSSSDCAAVPSPMLADPSVVTVIAERLLMPVLRRLRPGMLDAVFLGESFFKQMIDDAVAVTVGGSSVTMQPTQTPIFFFDGLTQLGIAAHPPTRLMTLLLGALANEEQFLRSPPATDAAKLQSHRHHATRLTVVCMLIAEMYEGLGRDVIITRAADTWRASLLPEPHDGSDKVLYKLNSHVARQLRALVSKIRIPSSACLSDASAAGEALRLRQAAYTALVSVLITTQSTAPPIVTMAFSEKAEQPIFTAITNTSDATIDPKKGLHFGGLPILTADATFGVALASLDRFSAGALPSTATARSTAARYATAGATLSSAVPLGAAARGLISSAQSQTMRDALDAAADIVTAGSSVKYSNRSGATTDNRRLATSATASLIEEGARAYSGSLADAFADIEGNGDSERETGGSPGDDVCSTAEPPLMLDHISTKQAAGAAPEERVQQMELDFFNSNCTMVPMLRLLDHVTAMTVALETARTQQQPVASRLSMPVWQVALLVRMTSEATPLATRLFICKLVLNRPATFFPWRGEWAPSLLSLMLAVAAHAEAQNRRGETPCIERSESVGKTERNATQSATGTTLHYMLRDVAVLIAYTWTEVTGEHQMETRADDGGWVPATQEDTALARDFLTYIFRAAPSNRSYLLRAHLAIIGALVSRWARYGVRVNFDVLSSYLHTEDDTSGVSLSAAGARVAVAVATLEYLIAADELPYDPRTDAVFGSGVSPTLAVFAEHGVCARLEAKRGKPLLIYTRFAGLAGAVIAAASRLSARVHTMSRTCQDVSYNLEHVPSASASSERESAACKEQTAAMWCELGTAMREAVKSTLKRIAKVTLSGANTQERGLGRYLACAAAVCRLAPVVADDEVVTRVSTVLVTTLGRAVSRASELELATRILRAGIIGGAANKASLMRHVVPHLCRLLKANVTGRTKATSVQVAAVQLVNAMCTEKLLRIDILAGILTEPVATSGSPLTLSSLARHLLSHPSRAVRSGFVDFLAGAWDGGIKTGQPMPLIDELVSAEDSGAAHAVAVSLRPIVRTALLFAQGDVDPHIRSRVYKLWNAQLPTTLDRRFTALLSTAFDSSSGSARAWLQQSASLLLNLATCDHQRFHDPSAIFSAPLDRQHAAFTNATVTTQLTGEDAGVASLRPLFSSAIQGAPAFGGNASSPAGGWVGYVRATQVSSGPQFSQTQESTGKLGGRGSDSGSLLSSFVPEHLSFGLAFRPQRDLLSTIAAGGSVLLAGSPRSAVGRNLSVQGGIAGGSDTLHGPREGTALISQWQQAAPSSGGSVMDDTSRVARVVSFAPQPIRPYNVVTSNIHATRSLIRRDRKLVISAAMHASSRTDVLLLRQYRRGELPDIQIPPSAIVLPLQALCDGDVEVACRVLSAVFAQVYEDGASTAGGVSRQARVYSIHSGAAAMATQTHIGHKRSRSGIVSNFTPKQHADDVSAAPTTPRASRAALRVMLGETLHNASATGAIGGCAGTGTSSSLSSVVSMLADMLRDVARIDTATSVLSQEPALAFPIRPALIGGAALGGLSIAAGIFLLEEGLLSAGAALDDGDVHRPADDNEPKQPPPIPPNAGSATTGGEGVTAMSLTAHNRRPPISSSSTDAEHDAWVHLQRLYAAIGDDDAVAAIVEAHAYGPDSVRIATSAERAGDLKGAVTALGDAINSWRQAAVVIPDVVVAPSDANAKQRLSPSKVISTARVPVVKRQRRAALESIDDDDIAAIAVEELPPDVDDSDAGDDGRVHSAAVTREARRAINVRMYSDGAAAAATSASHCTSALDDVLAWDVRRATCLAALQRWPEVMEPTVTTFTPGNAANAATVSVPMIDTYLLRSLGAEHRALLAAAAIRRFAELRGGSADGGNAASHEQSAMLARVMLLTAEARGAHPDGTGGDNVTSSTAHRTRRQSALDSSIAATSRQATSFSGVLALADLRLYRSIAIMLEGDIVRAAKAVSDARESIPAVFSALSPLAGSARLRALSSLHPLMEISEYLSFARAASAAWAAGLSTQAGAHHCGVVRTRLSDMLLAWRERPPLCGDGSTSPTHIARRWEETLALRRLYIALALEKLEALNTAVAGAASSAGNSPAVAILRGSVPLASQLASAALRATLAQASTATRIVGVFECALRHFLEAYHQTETSGASSGSTPFALLRLPLAFMKARADDARHPADGKISVSGGAPNATRWLEQNLSKARLAHATFTGSQETDVAVARTSLLRLLVPHVASVAGSCDTSNETDVKRASASVEDLVLRDRSFALQVLLAEAATDFVSNASTAEDAADEIAEAAVRSALDDGLACYQATSQLTLFKAPSGLSGTSLFVENVTYDNATAGSRAIADACAALHISIARRQSDVSVRAGIEYATFLLELMQHWENDDDDNGRAAILISTIRGACDSRDRLAGWAVSAILRAIRYNPAHGPVMASNALVGNVSAAAAQAAPLAAASRCDRIAFASTGLTDDCGVLSVETTVDASQSTDDSAIAFSASIDRVSTHSIAGGEGPPSAAVYMIPRVLELVAQYDGARDAFTRATADVSTACAVFPFIPWIPQLFAMIKLSPNKTRRSPDANRYEIDATEVQPPLARGVTEAVIVLAALARRYPQAVFYAWRIANDAWGASSSVEVESTRAIAALCAAVAPIRAALAAAAPMPLLNAFVAALGDLHSPELKLDDWVRDAVDAVLEHRMETSDSRSELPPARQRELYSELLRALHLGERTTVGRGGASTLGSTLLLWLGKWRTHIMRTLGGGTSVTSAALITLRARDGPTAFPDARYRPTTVAQLSQWLADYAPGDRQQLIELPGQYDSYDGGTPPDPRNHATIVGVAPGLRTMTSLRQPKRVTFVTDAEKRCSYLVKGGEDLRADARVQQFLRAAARTYRSAGGLGGSLAASAHRLRLRTFTVVPVTARIGLVEWVGSTAPLKVAIEGAANARLAVVRAAAAAGNAAATQQIQPPKTPWTIRSGDAFGVFSAWLARYAPRAAAGAAPDNNAMYRRMHEAAPAAEAEETWAKAATHSPPDLLRMHLATSTPSPEAYVAVRSRFAASLAGFSAAAYVLGVGDRHLENFLLDSCSGEVIAIDFGAVFGYATTQLGVPELLPFRLTPQLLYALAPLPAATLLERFIAAALCAMGNMSASRSLLAVLSVFARDPTSDWLAQARRRRARSGGMTDSERDAVHDQVRKREEDAASDATAALPAARLLLAALKLRGYHPAPLLMLDVLQNQGYAPNLPPGTVHSGRPYSASELLRRLGATVYGVDLATGAARRVRATSRLCVRAALRRGETLLLEAAITSGWPLVEVLEAISGNRMRQHDVAPLSRCPSATAHAAALVELATDPNVLARQWHGLATWM